MADPAGHHRRTSPESTAEIGKLTLHAHQVRVEEAAHAARSLCYLDHRSTRAK